MQVACSNTSFFATWMDSKTIRRCEAASRELAVSSVTASVKSARCLQIRERVTSLMLHQGSSMSGPSNL